jgi:hypothetical protein
MHLRRLTAVAFVFAVLSGPGAALFSPGPASAIADTKGAAIARVGTRTLPKTASGCPTSIQIFTAWHKRPGIMVTHSKVTGFAYRACWRNWVIAVPIATPEGNGYFYFSRSPILHGLSASELVQFNRQLCANPNGFKKWGEPGMC